MQMIDSVFRIDGPWGTVLIGFALILLVILVVSFRSRAVVFCQYLDHMTGVKLSPKEVRRVYKERGKAGVREFFLDLIIRQDLKEGPIEIPDAATAPAPDSGSVVGSQ